MINFDPGPLFYWMCKIYSENKTPDNKIVICNEGSSRSKKTWDTFHLIYAFCDQNRNLRKPLEIGVFRRTLKDCREKTYEKDFKGCAKTIGFYNPDHARKENASPDYYLFGNKIEFRGLDDMSEATAYDINFVNETLEVENEYLIKGLKMRCRKLFICDWNPRYTDHWVFKWEKIPLTFFSHTTYKHNKHLEQSVISEIESTSPWNLDDLHLPIDQRRPHEENIKNGTADKWYFMVYGMGLRASREGLVFPNVTYVDSMPDDVTHISYGCDFGQAAPSAIVKLGLVKGAVKHDLYLQKLFYAPTETSKDIADAILALGIDKHIWCDSNMGIEKGWISDLRAFGISALATKKFPGSRDYWIQTLKKFNLFIVRDKDFQTEQENFCYRVVDGIQLSETINKFDHLFSASGYACVGDFRYE